MNIILVLVAVFQSTAIALGMGSSTLAVSNFFVAIADGQIDPIERKMMGVTYVVLRVAMVLILITTVCIAFNQTIANGGVTGISAFVLGQLTITAVLFINAILMTARIMPSTVGPALQAGSWYTLGVTAALVPLGLATFTYVQFLLGYVTAVVLALSLVNGLMAYLKK